MNQQRIMELWEQANSQYYQSESDQPLPQFIFAELIVRECAKIVNDNDCKGSIVGDGMLFEHFGVE